MWCAIRTNGDKSLIMHDNIHYYTVKKEVSYLFCSNDLIAKDHNLLVFILSMLFSFIVSILRKGLDNIVAKGISS